MMMRHSRWSGRRLMPSGGGWMTPNPSGGVAACLVWCRDGRGQSDSDEHTAAAAAVVTCSNPDNESQPAFAGPSTYTDVNVRRYTVIYAACKVL